MTNIKGYRVYIAGPITNRLDTYKLDFASAKAYLESKGHLVMSPHVLPLGFDWEDYLEISIEMMMACDAVYVLKGWEESKGTKLEIEMAEKYKMEIIYQEEGDGNE